MAEGALSVPLVFGAGLLSFLSPCVLPLVPAYLGYLAGSALPPGGGAVPAAARRQAALHGVLFVTGFSLVFIALGTTVAGIGTLLRDYVPLLRRLGGVLIVLLGLHTAGILRLLILDGERRLKPPPPGGSPWRAFLLGATFSAGWTPCIGPVLASVLVLAGSTASWQQGMGLLAVYAAGLALPFLLLAFGLPKAARWLGALKRHAARVQFATGVLLVGLGMMVYADAFLWLNSLFDWGL